MTLLEQAEIVIPGACDSFQTVTTISFAFGPSGFPPSTRYLSSHPQPLLFPAPARLYTPLDSRSLMNNIDSPMAGLVPKQPEKPQAFGLQQPSKMAPPTQVIIIGTGWAGLAAAKTYLQINPSISLTLLSNESTVGGVWSKDRLYPSLIANSPNGLYEFTDLSMVDATNPQYKLIPGARVQQYLHKYAAKFDLLPKIRFNCKVTEAVRRTDGPGWKLTLQSGETLLCDKLIVSSGLHSKPKWPSIPHDPSFDGIVIHSKTLGKRYQEIISAGAKDIIIVGACKSAIEAATLFLDSDPSIKIHWLIRPSAQGVPMVVIDSKMKPNFVAVAQTRLFSVFGPTIFSTSGFCYRFLHSRTSWAGAKVFGSFWSLMSKIVKAGPQYRKSENGRLIEPQGSTGFWDGESSASSFSTSVTSSSRFLLF